jgi:hypothetical protein
VKPRFDPIYRSTSITASNKKISQSKGNAMNATARASRISLVLFTTLAVFFGQSAIAALSSLRSAKSLPTITPNECNPLQRP